MSKQSLSPFFKAAILSAIFLGYNAQAFAQLQCADVFKNAMADTTLVPLEWVKEQRRKAVQYIRNTSQYKAIEKRIWDLNQESRDISKVESDDFTVKIVDEGMDSRKAVKVILEDKATGKTETLLSSLKLKVMHSSTKQEKEVPDDPVITKYKNNNTVIPVEIQLSPTKKFLMVRIASKGSIDNFTLVVIDIETRKILTEIENINTSKVVWRSPTEFFFESYGMSAKSFYGKVMSDKKVRILEMGSYNESNSADQKWTYKRLDGKKYRISSTLKSFEFDFELQSRIERILKTTKNPETLWLLTTGKNGFKEILKIEIEGNQFVLKRVVDESNMVIDDVAVRSDHLVVYKYLGEKRTVEITDFSGKVISKIDAPGCCDVGLVQYDSQSQKVKVNLSSPVKEKVEWVYDLRTKDWLMGSKDGPQVKLNPEVAMMKTLSGEFVTEYKMYRSKDGTELPLRITYKKGKVFNSDAPVLMEAYGGFASNNYFHPEFGIMTYEFLKAGGVHIAPATRGSYYYGKKSHDQGRAFNKQNVIDDIIGATEWAIQNKISQPKKIIFTGDSHGGLVSGAVLTQRPDLFGLVIPKYGPLAFHQKPTLDPLTTPYQVSEYGDLINDPKAQALALQISPLNNITRGEYPMTVVITGRNDSRVNPQHSYLFAKKLQENQTGNQPILLYTNSNAGHWMGSIFRQDYIGWRATSDFWSIVYDFLGLKLQPADPSEASQ